MKKLVLCFILASAAACAVAGESMPPPHKLPQGWKIEKRTLGGVATDVITPSAADTDRVFLYLHGGGYVAGLTDLHRTLVTHEMRCITAKAAYLPEYRLSPENVYPAALEDATAAYKALLDGGIRASDVILFGDSAGGNLALALCVRLKELKLPQPSMMVLLSPWVTFEHLDGTSRRTKAKADYVIGEGTAMYDVVRDAVYAGEIKDMRDPRISPLYADLDGLPPMLILAGGDEIFLTECARLAENAAAGVDVEFSAMPKMRAMCWIPPCPKHWSASQRISAASADGATS